MLTRVRSRSAAVLLAAVLPASLALAACGSSDDENLARLDAVTISGKAGDTPTLKWKGTMTAGKAVSKVISEGDGAALTAGQTVLVNFTIANGYTHKINYDTYGSDKLAALVKVGEKKEPQTVSDLLTGVIGESIKAGQKVGSRIAVTVDSEQVFGEYLGNTQVSQFTAGLDIGNEDGLLYVADITAVAGPQGTSAAAPDWAPKLVETDGVPTSLDFAGLPQPNADLQVASIVKGTGPVVQSGQQILASYLGQVYQGAKPFDESYSKGSAIEAVVGGDAATVVEGWSQGLVGLPVGSRVLLKIPPKLGYGDQAQGEDIPANSTLYFVVDILDVADAPPPPPAPAPTEPTEVPTEQPSDAGSAATPSPSAS